MMTDFLAITTIGQLEAETTSIGADQACRELRELFAEREDACGAMVFRGEMLIGVISRSTFLRKMSSPFGPDIYARRSVAFMLHESEIEQLVLPGELDVHDAVPLVLQRPGDAAYEPIVVRTKPDSWRLLSLTRLLLAQSKLLAQANEIIRRQKREADSASLAKGQFLANMSHEIRTPMNGIVGMTNLVLETPLTDTQWEYLSMVKTSADWLLTVIDDVLDFSKIEAGKLEFDPLPFALRPMLDEWLKPLEFRARGKQLRLTWRVDAEIPQGVVADPVRIRQILVNLVGNAIKFTERGAVDVSITVGRRLGDRLELIYAVRDTGIGIPPDQLDKIFHDFEQVDSSHSRQFGGTGLGLAISQRLCEQMSGCIWVESEIHRGSVFRFVLPLEVAAPNQVLATGIDQAKNRLKGLAPSEVAPRRGMRVLVAEDTPVNQKLVLLLLEKRQHDVTMVDNGQAAVDTCLAGEFGVALIDIQMPQLDGFAATRLIREAESRRGRRTPIVALTAHAMKGDRERCLAAGMDGYVSKPIVADELFRVIDSIAAPAASTTPADAPAAGEVEEDVPWDRALKHTGGDRELLAKMASIFIDELDAWMGQLRDAVANEDVANTRRLAHSLKGSCGYFAADAAFAAASCLEESANSTRETPKLLRALEEELNRASHQIAVFAGTVSARQAAE
jgi:signal transduction histidine kinase/CheY-like chemotaxis protein